MKRFVKAAFGWMKESNRPKHIGAGAGILLVWLAFCIFLLGMGLFESACCRCWWACAPASSRTGNTEAGGTGLTLPQAASSLLSWLWLFCCSLESDRGFMKDMVYTFIQEHMMMHIVLIALSSAATLGAMAIDFVFGLIKARQRGEARTSTGYKKTASKAQKYFSPFMVLVFIDLICCVVIPFPVFSMLWAAYCVFCEFKSVREKSWQKAELRKAEKTMSVIIENKDEIAKLAAEILFSTKQKEGNEKS